MHQTALLLWLCFQLPRTLALPLGTDTAGLLCSHIASFDSADSWHDLQSLSPLNQDTWNDISVVLAPGSYCPCSSHKWQIWSMTWNVIDGFVFCRITCWLFLMCAMAFKTMPLYILFLWPHACSCRNSSFTPQLAFCSCQSLEKFTCQCPFLGLFPVIIFPIAKVIAELCLTTAVAFSWSPGFLWTFIFDGTFASFIYYNLGDLSGSTFTRCGV